MLLWYQDLAERQEEYLDEARSRLKHKSRAHREERVKLVSGDQEKADEIARLQIMKRQLCEEKMLIATQTQQMIQAASEQLDQGIERLEGILQAQGEFEIAGFRKGDEVAARVQDESGDNATGHSWILCRVLDHNLDTDECDVVDADNEDNIYSTISSELVPLTTQDVPKFYKGQHVHAMFPETTSFYPAVDDWQVLSDTLSSAVAPRQDVVETLQQDNQRRAQERPLTIKERLQQSNQGTAESQHVHTLLKDMRDIKRMLNECIDADKTTRVRIRRCIPVLFFNCCVFCRRSEHRECSNWAQLYANSKTPC